METANLSEQARVEQLTKAIHDNMHSVPIKRVRFNWLKLLPEVSGSTKVRSERQDGSKFTAWLEPQFGGAAIALVTRDYTIEDATEQEARYKSVQVSEYNNTLVNNHGERITDIETLCALDMVVNLIKAQDKADRAEVVRN